MSNDFLSDLFDGQEGIVYAPVKGETWQQHFFEWPKEQDKLERHLNDFRERDVYLSPVLFNEKRITPDSFKGTNYLWTEFDGVLPSPGYIEPSLRVASSIPGHEHWYWKLDHFETNKAIVEDLTRRIAYHYGADLSVWDYQNVLRPDNTWNHKRNKPVVLVDRNAQIYSIEDFLGIPIPALGTRVDIKLGGLPQKDEVLAKYKWSVSALDLLFKEVAKGKRSDALTRLAYECIEVGCSNEETYVMLEDRDSVWGKFVGRTDRQKQLEKYISYVRGRKATVAEIVHDAPEVYRFHDFMKTNIHLKWAIKGLLPVAGSMVIFGPPEVGKTTLSLGLGIDLALGKADYLGFEIVNKQRVLFISLEMQHYEVKQFFEDMKLPDETLEKLQEEFYIWPIGNAYPFDTPDQQLELLKYIKLHKIQVIIIDSLSLSMYGSVTSDDDIKRLNSFFNEDVRRDLKCSYIFIHHPRKESIESQKRDLELDDMFGSMYIAANAQTVISLRQKKSSSHLKFKILKTRHSQGERNFELERTPDRGFKLAGSSIQPSISSSNDGQTVIPIGGEDGIDKKPDANSLGKLFTL
jgi:archaellum biogenesis ATPase FlaH